MNASACVTLCASPALPELHLGCLGRHIQVLAMACTRWPWCLSRPILFAKGILLLSEHAELWRLAGISGASYYEGSFSNIQRSTAGDYVAVSSRGNFFLTWSPGQTYWQPHNRPTCVSFCRQNFLPRAARTVMTMLHGCRSHVLFCMTPELRFDAARLPDESWCAAEAGAICRRARRVQNMGWTPSNTLWLATRGGDVYLSSEEGVSDKFDQAKLGSRGFGILDVG